MYQGDIGQLKRTELDLENGTITRSRSKRKKGGLVVTYKLWPEVLDLLKKCVSKHPVLVLTDTDGEPLWLERENSTKDHIADQFSSIKDKYPELPRIKDLRKTGETAIVNEFDKSIGEYYRSAGTKGDGDKSYIAHQNTRLEKVTIWLHDHLGL
jgi:integrase